jgi:hypothetical protein
MICVYRQAAWFQDLQSHHAVSDFTRENRFYLRASIALIMRGKGWVEAARLIIRGQKTRGKDAYFPGMPWCTLQVISPNGIDSMIDC